MILLSMKVVATNVEDFSVCIYYNCDEIDGSILILQNTSWLTEHLENLLDNAAATKYK